MNWGIGWFSRQLWGSLDWGEQFSSSLTMWLYHGWQYVSGFTLQADVVNLPNKRAARGIRRPPCFQSRRRVGFAPIYGVDLRAALPIGYIAGSHWFRQFDDWQVAFSPTYRGFGKRRFPLDFGAVDFYMNVERWCNVTFRLIYLH